MQKSCIRCTDEVEFCFSRFEPVQIHYRQPLSARGTVSARYPALHNLHPSPADNVALNIEMYQGGLLRPIYPAFCGWS